MKLSSGAIGGIRWSKMPQVAVGSKYDGLAHIADWRATYATGVAGITAATIASLEQAPFQDESKNHWAGKRVFASCFLFISIVPLLCLLCTRIVFELWSSSSSFPTIYPATRTMTWRTQQ